MSIFKGTFFYTVGMLIPQAVGFFLLPLYSRLLSKSDFSIVSLLEAITLILSFVAVFALDRAVLRYLSNPGVCHIEAYSFFYTGALLLPAVMAFLAGIIWLLFPNQTLFGADSFYILLAVLIGVTRAGIQVLTRLIQFKERYYCFFSLSVFRGLLDFVIISLMFIYLYQDFRSPIYGMLSTTIIIYFSAAIFSRPVSFQMPSNALIKDIFWFCLPTIPTMVIAWFIGMSGRFFLGHYSDMTDVAEFSMAYKISYLLAIVSVAIQTSISKKVYFLLEIKRIKELNQYFQSIVYGLVFLTLIYSIAIYYLEDIVLGKQYSGIWRYCVILNSAMFISGIVGISSNLIFYHYKKNVLHLSIYILISVLFLFLYVQLIPEFAVKGAVLSLLIGHITLSMIHFYYSYRLGGITLNTLLKITPLTVVLISGSYVCL